MSCSVRVARAELVEALVPIKRAFTRKECDAPAIVSMEGDRLKVAFLGGSLSVAAEGSWAGEVRVPLLLFVRLAKNLPKGIPAGDPLRVEVREGRLWVGTAWGRCVWQAAFRSEIELPLDPDFLTLLRLPLRYPDDRLERAGLLARVQEAREKARDMIREAAVVLAPLGVTLAEVRACAEASVRRDPGGRAPS